MKFTLILTICSQIYGNCMPPMVKEIHFKTHYECATYGYGLAKDMMADLGQDYVNNNRLVIGFKCRPGLDI